MAAGIPPPPLNSPSGSYYWLEWYASLTNVLNETGYPWTSLSFSGSNLTDIQTRNHNELTNIQGGTATGTSPGGGNAWHITGRGYYDGTSVATGFPAGWSVANTSTGVYTVTHNLNKAAPNIYCVCTSHLTGALCQWIDVSNTNSVVVHITNPAGTGVNAPFSLYVST
jgi:hypothetical protein